MGGPDDSGGSWTLLTGHGHVLVEIARNPEARIRDLSAAAGITERTVQAIVTDLEAAGYITRIRTGRRTRYTINPDSLFRYSAQGNLRIGPFLALLTATGNDPARSGNVYPARSGNGDDPAGSGNGDDPARSGNGDDPARSGLEVEPSPG